MRISAYSRRETFLSGVLVWYVVPHARQGAEWGLEASSGEGMYLLLRPPQHSHVHLDDTPHGAASVASTHLLIAA